MNTDFTFDGHGINGPDKAATRIATLNSKSLTPQQIKYYGDLLAAAPKMERLLHECHALINMGFDHECDVYGVNHNNALDTVGNIELLLGILSVRKKSAKLLGDAC